ncbi:OmpH/Skp family outer membrane protein [Dysgonomonas sp.]|jgi:outer membrane protein|nr:OmpH family outer membrane protein [Prevotella sp.]
MKNVSYIINGVFAVAIIILFILFFTSNKKSGVEETASPLKFTEGDSVLLPLAYVNVDSIYLNYNLAKDANEALMKKYNSSNAEITRRQRQLEAEITDFQKKVQNNAFLSQERGQQEQLRIQQLEADLHALAQRYQEEYAREQQKMNGQIADSVRLCLKEYNKTANYQIIFSNAGLDNVLLAKDNYDITTKIITLLNTRYKPQVSK